MAPPWQLTHGSSNSHQPAAGVYQPASYGASNTFQFPTSQQQRPTAAIATASQPLQGGNTNSNARLNRDPLPAARSEHAHIISASTPVLHQDKQQHSNYPAKQPQQHHPVAGHNASIVAQLPVMSPVTPTLTRVNTNDTATVNKHSPSRNAGLTQTQANARRLASSITDDNKGQGHAVATADSANNHRLSSFQQGQQHQHSSISQHPPPIPHPSAAERDDESRHSVTPPLPALSPSITPPGTPPLSSPRNFPSSALASATIVNGEQHKPGVLSPRTPDVIKFTPDKSPVPHVNNSSQPEHSVSGTKLQHGSRQQNGAVRRREMGRYLSSCQ